MPQRPSALRWGLAALVAAGIVAVSSLFGPESVGWSEIFGSEPGPIYWQLRVPRTLMAAAAGASLSLGGAVFQSLFRNPLATPYTLGVASGAALAAALAMIRGVTGTWAGVPIIAVYAFAGSALAMSLVYTMARLHGGRDMTRLLLAGVCISYASMSGVTLIQYLSGPGVNFEVLTWMLGTIARLDRLAALRIVIVLVPVLLYIAYAHRALDLIAMGQDVAAGRGVAVGRTMAVSFFLVGALTAVVVAHCGPIGFVGLMVPHICRPFAGPRMLPLAAAAILFGSAFLAGCDALARSLIHHDLPVGVVTNILGAAFFFYLLTTQAGTRTR